MKPEHNCPVRKTTNPDVIGRLSNKVGFDWERQEFVLDFGRLIKTKGEGYEYQDENDEWQPLEIKQNCERCDYKHAKFSEQWQKALCRQCDLDYDSPSPEKLEMRM